MADDNETTISIDDPPRLIRPTKDEQLAAARVKALESRRRTQKMKLENKLQEVRILLGELSPDHIDRVIQVMSDRETELRAKHAKVLGQLNDDIQSQSKKREAESASIRRRIEAMSEEIRMLTQAITKKRKSDDNARVNTTNTPSTISEGTKATNLSSLSSLPHTNVRKR